MALVTLALTATLTGAPCPEGMIHYLPYCLTQEEYDALLQPTPLPTYPYTEGVEQWRSMVDYYWGKHGATDRMLDIMDCESRGRWWVMNEQGSGAEGLFQIMQFWKKDWPGDYKDPWTNAAVAYQIWLEQGYGAWTCSRYV
jgi:hypothetical protein